MAHQWYRTNLANATFPFYSDAVGRTIIMVGQDQNYNYLDQIGEPVKERGNPKAYYMHNCMPTVQGYQAIGYDLAIDGLPAATDFDDCFVLEYTNPAATVLFSPALGANYIFDGNIGEWVSTDPFPIGTIGTNTLVTTAFVNGVTYIYFENIGCYMYNTTTRALDAVMLSGLTADLIKGICAAVGYMIAFDDTDVVWSSTIDPTDFVPSIITGAGGGSLQYADGVINFCIPISNGFVVYCERNSVSATFSANINFPWVFLPVPKAGGVNSIDRVGATELTGGSTHHVWSTIGMQEVSRNNADLEFPEANDFLASLIFEDFDETTLVFTDSYLSTPLDIKVAYIAERFVVISYGTADSPVYTHALVFDNFLKRWGKLKIEHQRCFEWPAPNLFGMVTYGELGNLGLTYGLLGSTTYGDLGTSVETAQYPLKAISFLQSDGTVKIANFDVAQNNDAGVLMLGKFQFVRAKTITHQRSDIENVLEGGNFDFYIAPTLDGKTLLPWNKLSQSPYIAMNNPKSKRLQKQVPGLNFVVAFVGAFNLNSYLVDFTLGGDR